jgi:hypothetical protein
LGFFFFTILSTSFQSISIGFMSGDCEGHSKTLIFFFANQSLANLLVCVGSLSC